MKLVLLSGGSGKRLWPLSNDTRSKQFLKVLENEKHEHVSMVQRVWSQISKSGLENKTFIATGYSQVENLRSQVNSDVPIVIEPERRDTFPAIALSAAYLYSIAKVDLDETVLILPVDPYVEDHFFDILKKTEVLLNQSNADIALIGASPVYPSSKYGYIVPDKDQEDGSEYYSVSHFREKPSEEDAQKLIEQSAYWNCGVFAFKLGYLIKLMQNENYSTDYSVLMANYAELPKISFDYKVVEKASNIIVIPYEGYWKDLGTWNTLTDEMKDNQIGIGTISEDCSNTHLINELDMPITVLGVSNVIIAASPDGILISDKKASPRLKDYIDQSQSPRYLEKEWGWIRVLDREEYTNGRRVTVKRIGIHPGHFLSYQMHTNRDEVWTVVKGTGEFVQNGYYMQVQAGNVLHIPSKTMHAIKAVDFVEVIIVQHESETESQNESIKTAFSTWDEVAASCTNI
ncbi:sugar phosphate nucleotidyltransferase [Paenibacillus sp. NPDC057967]|uniref:sugar phosphate nucleotidyltransferase n=1 Tax=Paenibacillus sp. NPDC057967 TaxID=3346293 RepID=UPI0036DDB8EB